MPGTELFTEFPELAALGRQPLQAYCREWLPTPAAREFAITGVRIDDDLRVQFDFKLNHQFKDGEELIVPIGELLYYLVDRHLPGRADLHQRISAARRNCTVKADLGPKMSLYLTCKSCQAVLRTQLKGYIGQTFQCQPTDATCPQCGSTHKYDGNDLQFLVMVTSLSKGSLPENHGSTNPNF